MTHEEAIELVHAGHDGPLDERVRRELQAHLAGCERCRGLAAAYGMLHEVLREEAAHLATDEIVAYVAYREVRSPDERERVESHAAACSSCRNEIARVERVHESVEADPELAGTSRQQLRRRWPLGSWLATAAALFSAALLYPAYLGMYRLPSAEHRAQAAAKQLESLRGWSGAVNLELITPGFRDESDAPMVRIDPGRPFVLFGIQVAVTDEIANDAPIRFELLDVAGKTVASMGLTGREVRERVRSTGVVTWLVPSAALEPGEYTIHVNAADGTELIGVPVRVRRSAS